MIGIGVTCESSSTSRRMAWMVSVSIDPIALVAASSFFLSPLAMSTPHVMASMTTSKLSFRPHGPEGNA
jgi:hypothetical protein